MCVVPLILQEHNVEDVITAPPPTLHYCELLSIALLTSTQLMNNNIVLTLILLIVLSSSYRALTH